LLKTLLAAGSLTLTRHSSTSRWATCTPARLAGPKHNRFISMRLPPIPDNPDYLFNLAVSLDHLRQPPRRPALPLALEAANVARPRSTVSAGKETPELNQPEPR
jgi:hypothetical protein